MRNIVCQCGTCRHVLLDCATENCGHSIQDRQTIRQLLNQGQTRQQVAEYFIKKYGGQVALAAPIDRGFNRLAWLFPYSVAAVAVGGLGFAAYRMAKRPKPPQGPTASETPKINDQELADKLDDELRNLD